MKHNRNLNVKCKHIQQKAKMTQGGWVYITESNQRPSLCLIRNPPLICTSELKSSHPNTELNSETNSESSYRNFVVIRIFVHLKISYSSSLWQLLLICSAAVSGRQWGRTCFVTFRKKRGMIYALHRIIFDELCVLFATSANTGGVDIRDIGA